MHRFRKLGALALVVFALSAIGAANASAAQFTASTTGEIVGKATETQVFTFNGGTIQCLTTEATGTISQIPPPGLHITEFHPTDCKGFGGLTVHIPPATYLLTADGEVHLLNTLTIVVTFFSFTCHITIPPQTFNSYSFANNMTKLDVSSAVSGITYTTTGGVCGSSGSNGTLTGAKELELAGGGSISYDP